MEKKKFAGILAKPVKRRELGIFAALDDEQVRRHAQEVELDENDKLVALTQHYEIAAGPNMYFCLALALARDFVPGFQETKQSGRPSKWTDLNKGALVVEIERLIVPGDTSHGVSWAADQLARREPWKSFIEEKISAETTPNPGEVLRTEYSRFRGNRGAKLMREAFGYHVELNTLHEWENMVLDLVRNPHQE